MLIDLNNSNQFLEKLNSYNPEFYQLGFKVNILTMSNWLNIKKDDLIIEMSKDFINEYQSYSFFRFFDSFNIFFKTNHINTILYHNFFLGECEIIANLNLKKYIFIMSPFQTMICFLFNKNKLRKITLNEILNIFPIQSTQKIIDSIESLITINLLIKEGKDIFLLNNNFCSNQTKIIIKTNFEINSKNEENNNRIIQNQRKFIIDSKIMTIMKANKKLSHNELINAILSSLQNDFIPEILLIKNRIESLIEKGYISRKTDYYEYIA
jgi:hypothetical protein